LAPPLSGTGEPGLLLIPDAPSFPLAISFHTVRLPSPSMPTSAVPHYNIGLALIAQNRTAKAIEPYREAVKLVPGCANARNNLGMALAGQGRLDERAQQFRAPLQLDRESAGSP